MFLLNLPSFAGENSLDALLFLVFETLHCHIWGVTFMDCSVDLRTQKSKELDRAGTNVLTNIRTTKEKHSNSEFFGQCYVWPIFFCFSFWFVFCHHFLVPKDYWKSQWNSITGTYMVRFFFIWPLKASPIHCSSLYKRFEPNIHTLALL